MEKQILVVHNLRALDVRERRIADPILEHSSGDQANDWTASKGLVESKSLELELPMGRGTPMKMLKVVPLEVLHGPWWSDELAQRALAELLFGVAVKTFQTRVGSTGPSRGPAYRRERRPNS